MKIKVKILVFMLILTVPVGADDQNDGMKHETQDLNSQFYNPDSSCFIKHQQELTSLKQTLLLLSSIDFNNLGQTLYHLILDLQESTITKRKDSFSLPCKLVNICEKHYPLKYLLDGELEDKYSCRTNFYANGIENIFFIDKNNSLQIIDKTEFVAFHIGNTFVKLVDNNFPILILYVQGAQRILTNDNSNGLCVCPVFVNLDNLYNAQLKMKSILLHYVTDFSQIINTLSVTIDKEITSCLNNFKLDTICSGVECFLIF